MEGRLFKASDFMHDSTAPPSGSGDVRGNFPSCALSSPGGQPSVSRVYTGSGSGITQRALDVGS